MTIENADLVLASANVSRETMEDLAKLSGLLEKWNATINLVSKKTVDQIWTRHILDSVQLFDYGAHAAHWVDLGSGGGFPGVVIAILAKERAPQMRITLVESDQRKAVFLRHAGQSLGLTMQVLAQRIEAVSPLAANVVSARALAPLPQLCHWASRHLTTDGIGIFPKGKSFDAEIAEAGKDWDFSHTAFKSLTDPSAVVLVLKGISHV